MIIWIEKLPATHTVQFVQNDLREKFISGRGFSVLVGSGCEGECNIERVMRESVELSYEAMENASCEG